MAAWAPEEKCNCEAGNDSSIHSIRCATKVSTPAVTLPTPCPDCNQASFGDCECLGSAEPTGVEAFPVEVWEFFDDAALDQLITEAAIELGRRQGNQMEEKWSA